MMNYATELCEAYWKDEELSEGVSWSPNCMRELQDNCHHVWSSHPVPACIKGCGAEREPDVIVEFQEDKPMRRHDSHQPREYMRKKMEKLGGIVPLFISERDESKFRREVLECTTWSGVYRTCASNGVGPQFLCVPAFLNHPVSLGKFMGTINHLVYMCDYDIQFLYVAYKLSQLWSEPDLWIPLKITKPTLLKAETEWARICEDHGIPNKKTSMKDIRTPWA